jgi:hypothetical protein
MRAAFARFRDPGGKKHVQSLIGVNFRGWVNNTPLLLSSRNRFHGVEIRENESIPCDDFPRLDP